VPTIIERHGHTIDAAGIIHYDDRPVSWDRADEIAGRRLDRRKSYAIINGQVCSSVRWTQQCSGCDGGGCRECGHQGKVRREHWLPDDGSEPRAAVEQSRDTKEV
jgi:hypothetical protein